MENLDASTPVILLGGRENTLSATRTFGRLGVKVAVISHEGNLALRSRFCARAMSIEKPKTLADVCRKILIEDASADWIGGVIFPCSDEAIEFIADHHDILGESYRLEPASATQRLAFLDKRATINLAKEAGIPAPNYWNVTCAEDLVRMEREITFPVLIKPVNSAAFSAIFGQKLFVAENMSSLSEKVQTSLSHGLDMMVVEVIPGPDTLLSSYYTYFDADGSRLYDFTKKVIRRHPENYGAACCHETEDLPETAALGLKFFKHVNLRGMGNIEFKRDERDGMLKIIEVNARFTAALEHASRAGQPLDLIAYASITNQAVPAPQNVRQGVRFWYPLRDFSAARRLRRDKRLTWFSWAGELFTKKRVNPYFAWDDLPPVRIAVGRVVKRAFRKLI